MTSTLRFVLTSNSITVMLGARPYSIASTDEVYPKVVELVKANASEDDILSVINAAQAALEKATQITPAIAIRGGVVTYNGEAVDNSLTTRMLAMLDEGFDLVPMARFLENLMANPSYRAVNELYSFLEKGEMPITPDGHFMAYKAVRADYKDIHSGTFDNSIGQVCSMPRNAVDDDKNRTCSSGLHFCSFAYLPHFAHANGHVMLLKINPADVVSIPADYNDTKGRCAKYEVVGEYEGYYKENGPYFTSSVFDPATGNQSGGAFGDDALRQIDQKRRQQIHRPIRKDEMDARPAPARRGVVHRRQIVENQRGRLQHLQRRGQRQRDFVCVRAEDRPGRHGQPAAPAMPPAQRRVARRAEDFRRRARRECGLDGLLDAAANVRAPVRVRRSRVHAARAGPLTRPAEIRSSSASRWTRRRLRFRIPRRPFPARWAR